MNPSTRTRHLNQWIQTHSGQDMTYPALHGFLCARLVGPDAPDWQAPLAGLLPHDAELDEKKRRGAAPPDRRAGNPGR